MLFGMIASLLAIGMNHGPMATLLRGLTAGAGGLLGWAIFEGSIDLGDPLLWAVATTGGFGVGLLELRGDKVRARRKAKVLATGIEPQPSLSPELPAVLQPGDPAATRGLIDEWRARRAPQAAGAEPEPVYLDRGTSA